MLPVSQEFMDKMKSIIRRVYGKIQIDYTDPFLDQSIQMEANENNNISYPQQTADNVQNPMGKIASLDGSWVLDGSYVLAPGTNSEVYQIGWWGSQLSDVNGSFDMPYPTLTATFLSRPIQSLKVVGDTARQEYPINFVISLYDVNGEVVYIESVIDNTSPIWSKQINTITQIVKMELIITKWSHPNRQAKIMEFFTSIQETYEGEDILLIHLLEEREVANSSVPVGNISANEIKIKLNNETKKFDAGNTQSPLYETLKANRRIKAWLGIEKDDLTKELVPLGVFWSGDWNIPENALHAHTTGRDRLELLRKSTYSNSEVERETALHFNGSNYVTIPNIANTIHGKTEASIDFWVKKDKIQYGFIQLSGFANINGNLYPYQSETKVYLDIFRTSRLGPIYLDTSSLEWHHIAITTKPGANGWKLYQNGELIYTAIGEPTVSTNYLDFEIGRNSMSRYAEGAFRDIKLWDRALTEDEIKQNMHKPFYGNEKGLIGYWKFNDLDGVKDLTSNKNDGIIHGDNPTIVDSTNITLFYLAHKILNDAGLTEDEYWIDPELQQYTVPYAYFESQSHREALRKIAEACLGQVYCDRNGVIRIEGPSYLEKQTENAMELTQDDYFSKDNPVKWNEIANYIEVETQPLRPDVEQEVYRSNEPVTINAGETKTITAYYNSTPCIDATASIEGTGTIIEATYYAWGATIKVTSSTTGTFTLVINAKPLKILNKEKAIAKDDASIVDNGKLRYVFPQNPLVQTLDIAQTIADKLLQYYKNPRRDIEIDWRGNPALLLGDKIAITDKNEVNNYYVVKQTLEYSGALRAKISGRRV